MKLLILTIIFSVLGGFIFGFFGFAEQKLIKKNNPMDYKKILEYVFLGAFTFGFYAVLAFFGALDWIESWF
jgi:H+/Cl- antiporter ClcA